MEVLGRVMIWYDSRWHTNEHGICIDTAYCNEHGRGVVCFHTIRLNLQVYRAGYAAVNTRTHRFPFCMYAEHRTPDRSS